MKTANKAIAFLLSIVMLMPSIPVMADTPQTDEVPDIKYITTHALAQNENTTYLSPDNIGQDKDFVIPAIIPQTVQDEKDGQSFTSAVSEEFCQYYESLYPGKILIPYTQSVHPNFYKELSNAKKQATGLNAQIIEQEMMSSHTIYLYTYYIPYTVSYQYQYNISYMLPNDETVTQYSPDSDFTEYKEDTPITLSSGQSFDSETYYAKCDEIPKWLTSHIGYKLVPVPVQFTLGQLTDPQKAPQDIKIYMIPYAYQESVSGNNIITHRFSDSTTSTLQKTRQKQGDDIPYGVEVYENIYNFSNIYGNHIVACTVGQLPNNDAVIPNGYFEQFFSQGMSVKNDNEVVYNIPVTGSAPSEPNLGGSSTYSTVPFRYYILPDGVNLPEDYKTDERFYATPDPLEPWPDQQGYEKCEFYSESMHIKKGFKVKMPKQQALIDVLDALDPENIHTLLIPEHTPTTGSANSSGLSYIYVLNETNPEYPLQITINHIFYDQNGNTIKNTTTTESHKVNETFKPGIDFDTLLMLVLNGYSVDEDKYPDQQYICKPGLTVNMEYHGKVKDSSILPPINVPANDPSSGNETKTDPSSATSVTPSTPVTQTTNVTNVTTTENKQKEIVFSEEEQKKNTSIKTILVKIVEGKAIIQNVPEKSGTVTIPATVEKDGKKVPVTEIGKNAFKGTDITQVTIPSSVTVIRQGAFADCQDLSKVTITGGVKTIEKEAFKGCAIKEVNLPSSVKTIGDSAFKDCDQLKKIKGCKNVTKIGSYAFSGCAIKSFTVTSKVTQIGKKAFYECSDLTKITVKTKKLKKVGSKAFREIGKNAKFKLPKKQALKYYKLLKKKVDKDAVFTGNKKLPKPKASGGEKIKQLATEQTLQ